MPKKQKQDVIVQKAGKFPVWKLVCFGLCCMEQEFVIYCALAKDRAFDMSKFLQKTIERFWKNAASGFRIKENFYLAIEESRFELQDAWEQIAMQIIQDLDDFFMAVRRKDKKALLAGKERQISLIESYLKLTDEMISKEHTFIKAALAYQEKLINTLSEVSNKEKKEFLTTCKQEQRPLLLGDAFLAMIPKHAKEKPLKEKLPELRRTSLEFDEEAAVSQQCRTNYKDNTLLQIAYWLEHWDRYRAVLQEPGIKKEEEPEFPYFLRARSGNERPDYIDFAHYMIVSYSLIAKDLYLQHRDPAEVHGCWYLGALANWYTLRMYELKVPMYDCPAKYDLEKGRVGTVRGLLAAIACGEDELVFKLKKYATKEEQPWIDLLRGKDLHVQNVIERVWNDNHPLKKSFRALLSGDSSALRKDILQAVRNMRAGYNQYLEVLDTISCAQMRLAKLRGMELELPLVAELLEGAAVDFEPVDKTKWKLPGADRMNQLIVERENYYNKGISKID